MCYSKSSLRWLAEALGVLTLLLSVIPAVFSGNPGVSQAAEPPAFSAAYGLEHPLAGTIVRPTDPRLPTSGAGFTRFAPEQLIQALSSTDVILLGEKHDNPDHHALQTWVLRQVIQAGQRPGVVFEMMAEHLTRTLSRADTDGAVLIAGSWHVRTDYGVPAHLQRMAPETMVHSLAFIANRQLSPVGHRR